MVFCHLVKKKSGFLMQLGGLVWWSLEPTLFHVISQTNPVQSCRFIDISWHSQCISFSRIYICSFGFRVNGDKLSGLALTQEISKGQVTIMGEKESTYVFWWKNLKWMEGVIKIDFKVVGRCVRGLFGSAQTCDSLFWMKNQISTDNIWTLSLPRLKIF